MRECESLPSLRSCECECVRSVTACQHESIAMFLATCINMHIDMGRHMCNGMSMYSFAGVSMNICMDMYSVYRHALQHVYRPL